MIFFTKRTGAKEREGRNYTYIYIDEYVDEASVKDSEIFIANKYFFSFHIYIFPHVFPLISAGSQINAVLL